MYEQNLGELDGLNEYVEKRTKEKDEIIEVLRTENKRLDKKIKKQDMIIDIQWDIIACLMELKGVIEDE